MGEATTLTVQSWTVQKPGEPMILDERSVGAGRGEVGVEEAGFFVRAIDAETGHVHLSDRTEEALETSSLRPSPRDGALLCTVKRTLVPEGVAARFTLAAQAELLQLAEDTPEGPALRLAGSLHPLPI